MGPPADQDDCKPLIRTTDVINMRKGAYWGLRLRPAVGSVRGWGTSSPDETGTLKSFLPARGPVWMPWGGGLVKAKA